MEDIVGCHGGCSADFFDGDFGGAGVGVGVVVVVMGVCAVGLIRCAVLPTAAAAAVSGGVVFEKDVGDGLGPVGAIS